MGRKKKMRGSEGLTVAQLERRVYPEVGSVNTLTDVHELINAIESDNITEELKRQRLQFLYSLTHSQNFQKQFKGSILSARRAFKEAYQKYSKG